VVNLVRKKNTNTEYKICTRCLKEKKADNFYSAIDHPFYKDGRYPICKDCILELIGDTSASLIGLQNVLRMLDKPFLHDLWESSKQEAEKINGDPARRYMKNIVMPQYRNANWDDSIFGENKTNKEQKSNNANNVNFTDEEMEYLISFWGRGFTKEDYEFLQNEFEKLLNSYECDSYAMELLFQEVAHQRLTIKKKREKGDSVDKELKTLQDLLGSANVKPVQETGANAAEQSTFGTLIKKFENERPIPEPDEAWKDVDGIMKYIRIWFLGHLCKMLNIKNEYSDEYEEELNRYRVEAPKFDENDEKEGASE
jgi:hypothetical protein